MLFILSYQKLTLDITPPKYCMACAVKHLADKLLHG